MIIKTIVLLAVLYVVVESGYLWYTFHHVPKLPVIDQSDKTFGSGPVLRYIAAGDSTAVGEGASSAEKSYSYQVAQALAKDYTVHYKNIGVVGYKTTDVLQNQLKEIINYKPDIVTISMGANDATHLVSANTILKNYKTIINKLEQQTTAKIYITDIANFHGASILPWFYIQLIEWRSKDINPQIFSQQDDRVKIINIHDYGWSDPPYNDQTQTFAADHFHPNDLGYQNWTNAFLNTIK